MKNLFVLSALALAAAVTLSALACIPTEDPNKGFVTVRNPDDAAVKLRVTEEANCTLGLITELHSNTQTTYDVDKSKTTYLCFDGAKSGIEVAHGKGYEVAGGRAKEAVLPQ